MTDSTYYLEKINETLREILQEMKKSKSQHEYFDFENLSYDERKFRKNFCSCGQLKTDGVCRYCGEE